MPGPLVVQMESLIIYRARYGGFRLPPGLDVFGIVIRTVAGYKYRGIGVACRVETSSIFHLLHHPT